MEILVLSGIVAAALGFSWLCSRPGGWAAGPGSPARIQKSKKRKIKSKKCLTLDFSYGIITKLSREGAARKHLEN